MWHLSELDSPFARMGRFGAHQFQEHMADTRLYTAWFGGGQQAPQTNDVDVDDRGLVYLIDRNVGFDILEPTA